MPHAMGRKQGILVSVSERTDSGLEPGPHRGPVEETTGRTRVQTLEIDLRELSVVERTHLEGGGPFHEGGAPDGTARSRWLRHQLTGPLLILAADLAVLGGYAIMTLGGWRMLAAFWVTTVTAFQLANLYRPRLHVALLDDLPTLVKSAVWSGVLVAVVVERMWGTDQLT